MHPMHLDLGTTGPGPAAPPGGINPGINITIGDIGAKLGELNPAVPPDAVAVAVASGQPYPRLPFHKVAHMFVDVLCYVVAITLFPYMRLKDLSASVGVTEVACDHTHSVVLSSSRLL